MAISNSPSFGMSVGNYVTTGNAIGNLGGTASNWNNNIVKNSPGPKPTYEFEFKDEESRLFNKLKDCDINVRVKEISVELITQEATCTVVYVEGLEEFIANMTNYNFVITDMYDADGTKYTRKLSIEKVISATINSSPQIVSDCKIEFLYKVIDNGI